MAITEEEFADVCIDILYEWLEYFHVEGHAAQFKADRIDQGHVNGEAVFRVHNTSTDVQKEFHVTVVVKES